MFRRVEIRNLKSVRHLDFELGRCTVLIGANGSGKSNILEAIALAGAAASDKLDNEFLASRGIRVPSDAKHMRSAFDNKSTEKPIDVTLECDSGARLGCSLATSGDVYPRWQDIGRDRRMNGVPSEIDPTPPVRRLIADGDKCFDALGRFLIYSPEVRSLRNFESESQILPLGIRGEGLFRLLKSMALTPGDSVLSQIKEMLKVFDWFSDLSLTDTLPSSERTLRVRDRFLASDLSEFDQRSTNEGFLYLLFYFALFCSAYTPPFFAIDNVDDSLNPRLSAETVKHFAELSKQYDRQFIATTHQPGILDGLDLDDPGQVLYVVFRDIHGHTAVKRVPPRKDKGIRLSEAFIRGYLGGLPNNF